MNISFKVQGKSESSPIYVRVRDGRKMDILMKTNLTINPKNWSDAKGDVKHKNDEALSEISFQMQSLKTRILNQLNIDKGKLTIDKDWLSKIISPIENKPSDEIELFSYQLNQYVELNKDSITKSTIGKYKKVDQIFSLVADRLKIKGLKMCDLNDVFFLELNQYFREQNYKDGYKTKLVKVAQTIVKNADRKNVPTVKNILNQKYSSEESKNIYLTVEDINKIRSCKLDSEILEVTRDWLLISFETALRISDFMELHRDNIISHKEVDGTVCNLIRAFISKTKEYQIIPLKRDGFVEQILVKNKGDFPPKMLPQKYNKLLKELGKVAGIDYPTEGEKQLNGRLVKGVYPKYELISSHIGRRTFATLMDGLIPTSQITTMTGHKRESTFRKYIRSSDTEKAKNLKKAIDDVQLF